MDNPLTPNKIKRLMHLAEDKSFNMPKRLLLSDEDLRNILCNQGVMSKTVSGEASSGLIDLERIEGFGESGIENFSLSKSTAFIPGEMTGRSTGTDDINNPMSLGRHSLALESLTNQMDKQTSEIQDIMRHSIATNYSFHSKRDLTADEASFVAREAPLPIQNITHTHFTETSLNNSNLSMGAYFKNRCPEFAKILTKTDSPDKSGMPSITEVSAISAAISESIQSDNNKLRMDQTLDCVPVRQPRNNIDNVPEKQNNLTKAYETQNNFAAPKVEKQNEPSCSNANKQELFYMSQVPDKPKYVQMNLNHVSPVECKPVANAGPDSEFIMKLQQSLRLMSSDDTEGSTENSFSISKIADYLGKQSNVSVTDMLQYNNQKKKFNKKQPLTELHMNIPEHKNINQDVQVTHLKDTKRTETASSSGTINTVINKFQSKDTHIPEVVVTQDSLREEQAENEHNRSKKTVRSKSPSSKSHSTLSTVHENFTSFKSSDSPLHNSKGEANTSHVPSPNIVYKELDKSVDWDAVMQQKRSEHQGLAKEQWAEILTTAAHGFVGVSTSVTITITTLSDSWLTAKLQFVDLPNNGKDLSIELPRQPLLLSPGKSEKITLNITSNIELQTTLRFTVCLKDSSIDGDIEQKGGLDVDIKLPVIQAMSCDGINKITFSPVQEKACLIKSFVLISDCPEDLQLVLSVAEGDSMFAITSVQEINKAHVHKVLIDQASTEDCQQPGKPKNKVNKQLCRLACGNAIKITIKFNAPKLSELQIAEPIVTFNGILNVNLIGVNMVLRKVDLIGIVGTVNLIINVPSSKLQITQDADAVLRLVQDDKLDSHLSDWSRVAIDRNVWKKGGESFALQWDTSEPINIDLSNKGSISGIWMVKFITNWATENFPFKIAPSKFEIRPGGTKTLSLSYLGSGDGVYEATLIFEEISSGNKTMLEISGGVEKPKIFPIKTNYNTMSWVRAGRKELSLKNASNKKIYIRCQIIGEGFAIDLPRESRGVYSVPFGPCECRPLPIIFTPTSIMPHAATLHIVYDKNSDFSRKVGLFGCGSGEGTRWSGLVTYGDTALVRAAPRMPIHLELYNKASTPAFVCARVHFNLQYMWLASTAQLTGARRVLGGRLRHGVQLRVEWGRVERRAREAPAAAALATLTVLTGAEFTRRRILKIVKDESNGEVDISLLPEHLRVLADKFEGEDPAMDNMLKDFKETKASLNELIDGLHELTAQIDLPQDFTDENTIIISDDTVIEHHTLCD